MFHVEQLSCEPIQPSTYVDLRVSFFPQRFVMFRRECSTWNNCHVTYSAKYLSRHERFIFSTELWDDSVLVFHVEQFSYEPINGSTYVY